MTIFEFNKAITVITIWLSLLWSYFVISILQFILGGRDVIWEKKDQTKGCIMIYMDNCCDNDVYGGFNATSEWNKPTSLTSTYWFHLFISSCRWNKWINPGPRTIKHWQKPGIWPQDPWDVRHQAWKKNVTLGKTCIYWVDYYCYCYYQLSWLSSIITIIVNHYQLPVIVI